MCTTKGRNSITSSLKWSAWASVSFVADDAGTQDPQQKPSDHIRIKMFINFKDLLPIVNQSSNYQLVVLACDQGKLWLNLQHLANWNGFWEVSAMLRTLCHLAAFYTQNCQPVGNPLTSTIPPNFHWKSSIAALSLLQLTVLQPLPKHWVQ